MDDPHDDDPATRARRALEAALKEALPGASASAIKTLADIAQGTAAWASLASGLGSHDMSSVVRATLDNPLGQHIVRHVLAGQSAAAEPSWDDGDTLPQGLSPLGMMEWARARERARR